MQEKRAKKRCKTQSKSHGKNVHVLVCVHGSNGAHTDWRHFIGALDEAKASFLSAGGEDSTSESVLNRKKVKRNGGEKTVGSSRNKKDTNRDKFDDFLVFCPRSNNRRKTTHGVLKCGERMAQETVRFLEESGLCPPPKSTRVFMSFVCHSLGGLITRAALPLLFKTLVCACTRSDKKSNSRSGKGGTITERPHRDEQMSNGETSIVPQWLIPWHYYSLSTPHLGSRRVIALGSPGGLLGRRRRRPGERKSRSKSTSSIGRRSTRKKSKREEGLASEYHCDEAEEEQLQQPLLRRAIMGIGAHALLKAGYFQTGRDLLFEDSKDVSQCILSQLSNPSSEYMKALALFRGRTLGAVAYHDIIVPFGSAAASPENPHHMYPKAECPHGFMLLAAKGFTGPAHHFILSEMTGTPTTITTPGKKETKAKKRRGEYCRTEEDVQKKGESKQEEIVKSTDCTSEEKEEEISEADQSTTYKQDGSQKSKESTPITNTPTPSVVSVNDKQCPQHQVVFSPHSGFAKAANKKQWKDCISTNTRLPGTGSPRVTERSLPEDCVATMNHSELSSEEFFSVEERSISDDDQEDSEEEDQYDGEKQTQGEEEYNDEQSREETEHREKGEKECCRKGGHSKATKKLQKKVNPLSWDMVYDSQLQVEYPRQVCCNMHTISWRRLDVSFGNSPGPHIHDMWLRSRKMAELVYDMSGSQLFMHFMVRLLAIDLIQGISGGDGEGDE